VKPWQLALLEAALSALPKKGPLFASWTKIDRDLKLACKKAGVAPCSTNDLRRTFGTWMRADGLGSELHVAMGHVDSRMYERVYARLNPKQLAALMTVQPVCTTDAQPLNACNSEHCETAEKQAVSRESSAARDAPDRTVNHRVAGSSPAAGAEKQGVRSSDPGDCAAGVHAANDTVPAVLRTHLDGMSAGWDALERLALAEDACR
jgi:hypothetical protein